MRLYHNTASPFVRKVMVVLHETGQTGDVELIHSTGTTLEPGTLPVTHNPLGKIPALERQGAATLYDSRVICRFLNARAGAGLYPTGTREWETLTLEATADGILDAAVLIVYEARLRAPEMVSPAIVEAQWRRIERTLDALEGRWLSHLAGPLDIGQIAVGCALGYLDFRHEAREWRKGHEGLADWYARFSQRDSMKATAPPSA
jgi:glutathione S-transferase